MPSFRSTVPAVMFACLASLVGAGGASAAVRFASPNGSGASPCIRTAACPLTTAINAAQANDEVVIEPGSYTVSGTLLGSHNGLNIHGAAGQPRPAIQVTPLAGLSGLNLSAVSGATLSRFDLTVISADQNTSAIDMQGDATLQDATVRIKGMGEGVSAHGGVGGLIRDVTVRADSGIGIYVYGANVGLRHVTSYATDGMGGGRGLDVYSTAGAMFTSVTATDSIFLGGDFDVFEAKDDDTMSTTVTLDYDDFVTTYNNTSPGRTGVLNLGTHNIAAPALFVSTTDFHQLPGSPTIDAGNTDALSGTADFDGDARLLGQGPDIGADEFLSAATAVTGTPSNDSPSSEVLRGTVNAENGAAGWHFEYGTTTAYGTATAPQTIIGSNTDQPVSVTVAGLISGATYHERLVVVDDWGDTILGADTTFLVPVPPVAVVAGGGGAPGAVPPPPPPPPPPGDVLTAPTVPTLTGLKQSSARWRRGTTAASIAKAKRPPLGTTFHFTVDRAAAISVSFTRRLGGRTVRGHCAKRTKANTHATACRLKLSSGILHIAAHPGRNTLRFSGRLTKALRLHAGAYTAIFRATADGLTSQPATLAFTIVSG